MWDIVFVAPHDIVGGWRVYHDEHLTWYVKGMDVRVLAEDDADMDIEGEALIEAMKHQMVANIECYDTPYGEIPVYSLYRGSGRVRIINHFVYRGRGMMPPNPHKGMKIVTSSLNPYDIVEAIFGGEV